MTKKSNEKSYGLKIIIFLATSSFSLFPASLLGDRPRNVKWVCFKDKKTLESRCMPTNSTAPPGAIYEKDAKGIAQKYYKSQKGMPVEDEYLEKIWNKIMEQKPHSISTNKPLRVAVRVFMNENGDVKNVMFREPSGNDRFDAELVRTIYKIGSFGKLPKYLVKKARTTGFIFEFKF